MFRVRQFIALARLTAMEAFRQPIFLLMTAACVLLTALQPMLLLHKMGEDGKLARDTGLACHFLFGLLIAGSAAGSALSRELRLGTAAAVLSKPVGRGTFFSAKFTGLAAVLSAFSVCAIVATLLAERASERFEFAGRVAGFIIDWQTANLLLAAPFAALLAAAAVNYLARRPFPAAAFGMILAMLLLVLAVCGFFDRVGRWAPYDLRIQTRIVPAGILVAMALVVITAIALGLSTRMGTAGTITACVLILLLGLLSDHLFGRHASHSVWAALAYAVVPNWQHFWAADALNRGGAIPWAYVLRAGCYAGVYTIGILCLGILSFHRSEAE